MILSSQNAMAFTQSLKHIATYWIQDEKQAVEDRIQEAQMQPEQVDKSQQRAMQLVKKVRDASLSKGGLDAFMNKYDLSSEEGIVLMCLAEALLRVPDKETADRLIRDKLTSANWHTHLGDADHMFVNAATWALMLTGKVLDPNQGQNKLSQALTGFLNKRSRFVIRRSVLYAMHILGKQYVMGQTIDKALKRARQKERQGYLYSYDMLGEAAMTEKDAKAYYQSYYQAIESMGKVASSQVPVYQNPGISIKLSALYPRYELAKFADVASILYPRLLKLVELAASLNVGINIDAEESERLEMSLALLSKLAHEPSLNGFQGIGFVVQAYQKRAPYVLDYIIELSKKTDHRFMVRLVKGAYWDAEIKQAQTMGIDGFPVYTRKCYTDVSYQACAKKILANTASIYPQFATHNAYTVSMILTLAKPDQTFEFQCLHGMGDALYDHVVGQDNWNIPCRIYAPVGGYKHLLPYLVRRLLENGANSSFVNRIVDVQTPIEKLVEDPVAQAKSYEAMPHPQIVPPSKLFGEKRVNSKGFNLNDSLTLEQLAEAMTPYVQQDYQVAPIVSGQTITNNLTSGTFYNPATGAVLGQLTQSDTDTANQAMDQAAAYFETWEHTPGEKRAALIEKFADLLESEAPRLMAIAIQEAGKTLENAVAEVREAVDFCRYYSAQVREYFVKPTDLPGPTGETNQWYLHGRGAMVCISPWNFPLAIFTGEVSAALAAGNTVVAKPAEQTSLIAQEAVKLMHQAGIPKEAVHFVPGSGETIGAALVNHSQTAGVIFTGSLPVAKLINQTLSQKPGPIVPFIAETGGQNAMVVDSSALPEQVVADVVNSAFNSAGQRCSALRVLYLQDDIADDVIEMLKGAIEKQRVGDPANIETDVGPVIDGQAREALQAHIDELTKQGRLLCQAPATEEVKAGHFVLPSVFEINDINDLEQEFFGPILHIVRYQASDMQKVADSINQAGYGLTFGVHSRIESTIAFFQDNIRVGNVYVNRDIVGAIVGSQPFGGHGLSGTGPKAGGPFYLHRLTTEKVVSTDTTAAGGNASLMTLNDS